MRCMKRNIHLHRIIRLATIAFCFGAVVRAEAGETAAGITEPMQDVTLTSSVAGIISKVCIKEGETVNEGEVILELDKRLEELEEKRRKLVMERNKSDMESTQVLFKTGKSVSKDEMEKKETDYQVSEVEHAMAAQQLAKRSIESPITGTVAEIVLQAGNSCQPYETLARVVNTKQCKFVVNLEANSAAKLHLGQKVDLEIGTGSKSIMISATVQFISPVVDPASGLVKVRALFDNAEGLVRPGVAGKMHLN